MSQFTLLKGAPVAELIQSKVAREILSLRKKNLRPPNLCVILIGNDLPSQIYTRKKGEIARSLGIHHKTLTLSETVTPQTLKKIIDQLNSDQEVDAILLQRPLPAIFNFYLKKVEENVSEESSPVRDSGVNSWIVPEKDVDAFHPLLVGQLLLGCPGDVLPCTPSGIMELLKYYGVQLSGKTICVIGRSNIVGKPISSLLLQANATVIQCHSQTQNLRHFTLQSDVLIVAIGKRQFIDSSFIKKGAVVIDVGINRASENHSKISGDVDFKTVAPLSSAITPVPGGVGLVTLAMLMKNTMTLARKQIDKKSN